MINPTDKIVAIVGLAATGKTTLADKLLKENPSYKLIHTDDYIGRFELLCDSISHYELLIIEGTQVYTMLKSYKLFPDLVIELVATTAERERRCIDRGSSHNIRQQDAILMKQWREYKQRFNVSPPRFEMVNTEDV